MRLGLTTLAREHVRHMKLEMLLSMALGPLLDRFRQNLARLSVTLGSFVDTPQPSRLAQRERDLAPLR
jgi:hypothetical protein